MAETVEMLAYDGAQVDSPASVPLQLQRLGPLFLSHPCFPAISQCSDSQAPSGILKGRLCLTCLVRSWNLY